MDADDARQAAIAALDGVLAGRTRRIGELRKSWPELGADFLLRRARQEAEHYLATGGPVERSIVELMRSFLEKGGTPGELERAYDEVIRETLHDRPQQS